MTDAPTGLGSAEVEEAEPTFSICAVQRMGQRTEVDELALAQEGDVDLQKIIQLKIAEGHQKSELPGDPAIQLQVQGSRLVRIPPAHLDTASQVQVVLPKSLVPQVLPQLHNSPTGGHLGVQKLQAKVKDRFYWSGWFSDVQQWCRECVECGSHKEFGQQLCAPLQSSVTSRPYERVALDILGPLPETSNLNKYILVVGYYFSKWTESFPLPNQEAKTVTKVLMEEWVCRFGDPRTIHTDQGRNFGSTLFRELCHLLNIHKTRTSPYHPQSNGMIERFKQDSFVHAIPFC